MNYTIDNYKKAARSVISEGIVLLKNENQVLPLKKGASIALFGRNQFHYYKSGTGSGGMVNTGEIPSMKDVFLKEEGITVNRELIDTYEAWLKDHPFDKGKGWAAEPWHQEEMPITEEQVKKARSTSDMAVIFIGRSAGEDHDNEAKEGSYLLTKTESEMIKSVCSTFEKTIVLLNVGNVIDMKWVEEYNPTAVAYIWQGGQEGTIATMDVLMGRVNPSGKLPDTIAKDVNLIPSTEGFGDPKKAYYKEDIYVGYRYFETFHQEDVAYPFGFGLSYTNFEISYEGAEIVEEDDIFESITLDLSVTNTGNESGKEVLQVYYEAPQGLLGKPSRVLAGFAKTKLLAPGESEVISITVPVNRITSYDAAGVTGFTSAYVLEKGTYTFYAGSSVRDAVPCESYEQAETALIEQLSEAAAPENSFDILTPKRRDDGTYEKEMKPVRTRAKDYEESLKELRPSDIPLTGNKGYTLSDVADDKISIEEFIAQLTPEELASITRGEGMCSPKVTPGIAGAIGGVTESLKAYGLPVAGCSDGPSGIRMDCGTIAFSMPNGTLLASTFNTEICQELYEWEGLELRKNKIDSLLGPGMNIHRNPLNGRNFEYFSEDPLLTGLMAAAQLKGMHKYNVTGTIKHFACNNQETNRHGVEANVSERALREIYLKGFEIAVKEGGAYSIMTAYNPLNGHWTASHAELLTTILRNEWGYDGIVMTDWWARGNFNHEKGTLKNTAAKIQAQNDLMMVNANASDQKCDNTLKMYQKGRITLGEMQRSAINICRYLLKTPVFDEMKNGKSPLVEQLKDFKFDNEETISKKLDWYIEEQPKLSGDELMTDQNSVNLISIVGEYRGIYRLSFTVRAKESAPILAQIPFTLFQDQNMVGTVSITGADKEWQTFTFEEIPLPMLTCTLRLRFSQGGMEIKDMRMELVKEIEIPLFE